MVDKSNVKAFYKECEKALAEVGKKYGVAVDLGNTQYNMTGGWTKLSWKTIDRDGNVAIDPNEETAAENFFHTQGVDRELVIGSMVRLLDGTEGKIIGWNTRKKHSPMEMEINGEGYYVNPNMVTEFI